MDLNVDVRELLARAIAVVHRTGDDTNDSTVDARAMVGVPQPGPTVNLLPAKFTKIIADKRRARLSVFGAAAAATAVLVACAGTYIDATNTSRLLDEATARNGDLSAQLATYAPVTNLARQTNELTATVSAQTEEMVAHDEVIAQFLETAGQYITFSGVALFTQEGSLETCRSTDSFNQTPIVGCIRFEASGTSKESATSALRALNSHTWFTDAFIPTISQTEQSVTNDGTVGITMAAVTDPDAQLEDENDQQEDTNE